jgi:hypothetical protein
MVLTTWGIGRSDLVCAGRGALSRRGLRASGCGLAG